MSDIAVIGCGAFGATIALRLRSAGFSVTVYDRLLEPLSGASYNNQNRLHLGFHYPRDLETARQCVKGFSRFIKEFPDVIRQGFPNGYFISSRDSATTPEDYFSFCDKAGLSYKVIAPNDFPVRVRNVACGLVCDELVYDSALLRRQIMERLAATDVPVHLGCELSSITNKNDKIELTLSDGKRITHDAVVNASYANNNHLTKCLGHDVQERQYEYTVVPIIEAPFASTGITVMDGRFMTVLPFGKTDKHLLYHVEHTVVATDVGDCLDRKWLDPHSSPFANSSRQEFYTNMLRACEEFIPDLASAKLVGFLQGPRMVLARSDDTDARPSLVDAIQPNYVTVFSGKVDHSIWIADDVVQHFQNVLQ